MKGTSRIGLALVLTVALVLAEATWGSAAPFAYITNAFDNTVSVIDTATNAVVGAPISGGPGPYGVAVTPDGSRVYVGNFSGNTVSVISTATNTVVATVTVGSSPIGVAVTPDGSRVYVANYGNNTVSVISTATNTVGAPISVGSSPYGVAVTPDGSSVYVANSGSNTVSVISTATNTVGAPISVGSGPSGVAVTPDGSRVYVANSGNTVSVISTATNPPSVVATVTVGSSPSGVAVTPDGSRVYVANYSSNTVSVISTATNMVVGAPIQAGSNPYGVAVTPDGSNVYVANSGNTNTVSVISTATNTVVATVHVGSNPIAFGKFIGGKPAPILTDVPKWYQVGIPDGPCYPTSSDCFPKPGNFYGVANYDSEINRNVTPPVPYTIAQKGCALTALTIVVNYWKGNRATPMYTGNSANVFINPFNGAVTYPGLDPSQVNTWKDLYAQPKDPNNFLDYGNVILDTPPLSENAGMVRLFPNYHNVSSFSGFPVFYTDTTQTTIDPKATLDNILRNWAPVILPIFAKQVVDKQMNEVPFHFVVVTGKAPNGDYYVNDPGDRNSTTLNTLAQVPVSWLDGRTLDIPRSFENIKLKPDVDNFYVFVPNATSIDRKDPNTLKALSISSNAPVELVLTDPQGRRTGFNPVSNTLFQDIPVSAYTSALFEDEQTFTPDGPPFKILGMANQMDGQYTLDVIGTGSGNFTVVVSASDAAGNWITQTYSGTTAPGATSQVTFQGAVTVFAAFSANVAIKNSTNQFAVGGQFTLGAGSPGINPLTQPVTLQVGAFSITIPAGSFQLDSHGNYVFQGTINGVQLAAGIQPQGGNQYAYGIAGQSATNLPAANPVAVRLAIGSNGGNISVNATFTP